MPDGVLLGRGSLIALQTNLKHELRSIVLYREDENVVLQYAAYLCTKKSVHVILVTLRAVHLRAVQLGNFNEGMLSIWSFFRPNKRNACR